MRHAGGKPMKVDIRAKSFGGQPILRNISFEVGPRERLAILGPSGIGKTTLIRIIASLDGDFEGVVKEAGRISFAFQEPTLLPWRSVHANLTLATRCSDDTAQNILETVGLGEMAPRFPNTLSLGQARRVALARAFLAHPDTLILDEPFASLDEASAARMEEVLADLLARHPARLLIVTHDPAAARRVAEREIALEGPPAQIRHDLRYAES